MFETVEFDEEDHGSTSGYKDLGKTNNEDSTIVHVRGESRFVQFHAVGDADFSIVADTKKDGEVSSIYDSSLINGDSWGTCECRCLRCEILRVSHKIENWRANHAGRIPVLVLLDLDNFGFNQFKSFPPSLGSGESNPFEHVFLWSFFGSCFTRHHQHWPTEDYLCEPFVPKGKKNEIIISKKTLQLERPSVWQILVNARSVHLTPCGGQKQAADGVIVEVIKLFFKKYPMVLITGDIPLLNHISSQQRPTGKKSRRIQEDEVNYDDSYWISFINVNDSGKRFIPVWRELGNKLNYIFSQKQDDEFD